MIGTLVVLLLILVGVLALRWRDILERALLWRARRRWLREHWSPKLHNPYAPDFRWGFKAYQWGLALLLAMLAVPAFAQDVQSVPPVAPVETPAPEPTPAPPAPKLWRAAVESGPSTISQPEEGAKLYASMGVTVTGEPRPDVRLLFQASADRTSNGAAFSLEAFKSFRSVDATVAGYYRIKNLPLSVGGTGSLAWSVEQELNLRDPNLWSFGAEVCLERFKYWSAGGVACVGGGRWSGRDGIRIAVEQPLQGETVLLRVASEIPFAKLPEVVRALPGALAGAPLTAEPTPEQVLGIAQRLPVAVEVKVLVRPWARKW